MANFDFTKVTKGKNSYVGENFPSGTARVTRKTLVLGSDGVTHCQTTKYETEAGGERIRVSLAVDLRNQAIQIKPDPQGFTMLVEEGGRAYAQLPVNFRKAGLPVGDYKLVEDSADVYQLAR